MYKDAVLKVDATGGGDNFTALAIIEGGKNLDVQMMIENGSRVG